MSVAQWQFLELKVSLVIIVTGCLLFIMDWTRLTKGAVWRDNIGFSFILKDVFIIVEALPLLMASFFHLDTFANMVWSWVLVNAFMAIGLLTYWRLFVFEREDRKKRRISDQKESSDDTGVL